MLNKFYILLFGIILVVGAQAKKNDEKPEWAKKDIRDYSEADMERLLDQWNVSYVFDEVRVLL